MKQPIRFKQILFALSLIAGALLIYLRAKGVFIFVGGFVAGCLSLMVLRTILWNTHKLIKDKD